LVLDYKPGKHLEMVAAEEGNYTMWVDKTNLWVLQNEHVCTVHFHHDYQMIPNFHPSISRSEQSTSSSQID
jgi:hypothetical protein